MTTAINFTGCETVTVTEILIAHDQLQRAVERHGLLEFEEQPQSEEWQLAYLVGEIELLVDYDEMVEAVPLIRQAVRRFNDLFVG